ncbi:TSL-kinase interacting protein 1 isoform X2 [Neltuma alba]|uniref:TSL-kinase interacting protein 1 isoform X1 n=1 Tax=Neltuma alba TaxID=207710 RepID=UPI0010A48822|nr:TSL-kinase interacting protein 1-like isoform X1 [Prosopis alba]XP_028766271.1 TSL-kinase interacting protein 1-like isoform X2 [Prosopis alba]
MQSTAQISLDSNSHLHPETVSIQNGGPGVSSTANIVLPQQPAPKKPTRQWAAWTRQEEESFFTALRQVGKNFEKITCRVQSKNKDQVRHYYYRLVRRMNKLLGPELCLDAKNSKDTNAAMLRWWSLLEKYSCKASKLHLKPRKFKIFVEALEHQLMKDRKKNVRRRPLLGENYPPAAPNTVSNQSRTLGNDARTVKLVLVDSQNIQSLGTSKASLKRNVNMGVNRSNTKGESTAMKPSRQRKKPGMTTAAAYKKWEKAAMAGVSLVADAAEHLERAATVKDFEHDQGAPVEKCSEPVGSVLPSLPTLPQNHVVDNIQNIVKLKLQLFPIDDCTRRALERDNHNPYLELTLSTRKKLSSVIDHLNRKWGNSSIAVGQIMLFPYNTQKENLASYQRWTQESTVSAGDVYGMIGSPPTFRLRYGWFSHAELGPSNNQVPVAFNCMPGQSNIETVSVEGHIVDPSLPTTSSNYHQDLCEDRGTSATKNLAPTTTSTDLPNARDDNVSLNPGIRESGDATLIVSSRGVDAGDEIMTKQADEMNELRLSSGMGFSAGEWADSLTNISIGDLLSGASEDLEDVNPTDAENCNGLLQIPFSADSFDAAIAAHISRHQEKMGHQPTLASHISSIWDAEETCDAFLFRKDPVSREAGPCLSPAISAESHKQVPGRNSDCSEPLIQQSPKKERPGDNFVHAVPMDGFESKADFQEHSAKDFSGLADIYWPDSLGPLDIDIPSTKYHSQDLILSDSLGGLSRLIASSLDAFQNCSFFGIDKKES